jgi:hypothetical protein
MSKNAMAGAVTLCGVGLCMIGGAMLMQSGGQAHAAPSSLPAAAAVSSVASAQAGGEPTVVWYGVGADTTQYGGTIGSSSTSRVDRLYRAWSDGTIELKRVKFSPGGDAAGTEACGNSQPCSSPWIVISSPTQGFKAAADINADEIINGADIAFVLSNWGDAPRVPFPPSDCPLNLINP